jgi:hypothetical protein
MIKREQHPTIKLLAVTSTIFDNTDLSSKQSCSGRAHFRATTAWFFSMRNACAVSLAPLFGALDNTSTATTAATATADACVPARPSVHCCIQSSALWRAHRVQRHAVRTNPK